MEASSSVMFRTVSLETLSFAMIVLIKNLILSYSFSFFCNSAGILTTTSALTIGENADMTSENLTAQAQTEGFWKPEDGPLDFAKAFASSYEGISLSDKQTPENRLNFMQNMLRSISDGGKTTT